MGNTAESFRSRGIGSEWDLPCFVTGHRPKLDDNPKKSNIAAFVDSRETGERIVRMFGGLAVLDYRHFEPNWVQVKVGVSKGYEEVLNRLDALTREAGNIITPEIIAKAKEGFEPKLPEAKNPALPTNNGPV